MRFVKLTSHYLDCLTDRRFGSGILFPFHAFRLISVKGRPVLFVRLCPLPPVFYSLPKTDREHPSDGPSNPYSLTLPKTLPTSGFLKKFRLVGRFEWSPRTDHF